VKRWLGREAVWVAVLVLVAGWWGGRYVQRWRDAGRPQVFYQQYFEPALMIACGRGFDSAMQMAPPVEAFVQQRTDAFDCAQLPPAIDFQHRPPAATYQYAWFYLMWTVGLFWKVFGVSWSGLVPLFAAMYASVVALAYATFRLAVPPWAAFPAATALIFSQLHSQNLPHLRDYAKAPLVLALFLIMFVIVKRAATPARLLAWSALYGLVLGIGYGFRTDLLANILPFIVAVAAFVPGFRPQDLAVKAAALVLAGAIFIGIAWPVIAYVTTQGGCQWHVMLLGLEYNYNDNLGVVPSYYQWIPRYTDEYLLTSVNSYLVRVQDAAPVPFCTPAYDSASAAYLKAIATTFPADFLTRAYASILRVTDLPFHLWGVGPDTTLERSRIGYMLMDVVGTARLAVAVMVLALGAISWRLGLFAAFVVAYVASYPMLQFANRHFFHLEFLGWWGMAFVFWLVVRTGLWALGRMPAPWPAPVAPLLKRAIAFAGVVLVAVMLPMPIARAYHDRSASALIERIMTAPRMPLAVTPGASGSDLAVAVGDTAGDPTRTVYLDVRVDLAACPKGVPLALRYDPSNPFADFSSTIQEQPRGVIVERYLTPVFSGFQGISTGASPASCVSSVERLSSLAGIALLPTLTLPAAWRDMPPHQQVGAAALRVWRLGE
jgi:hypothetical protein